jgi:hypothetical protein
MQHNASFEVQSYEWQACSILLSSDMYRNCKLVTFFEIVWSFGEWVHVWNVDWCNCEVITLSERTWEEANHVLINYSWMSFGSQLSNFFHMITKESIKGQLLKLCVKFSKPPFPYPIEYFFPNINPSTTSCNTHAYYIWIIMWLILVYVIF